MNSQGFGVRFLMTVLGTGTNLLWSRIDEDLRKMTPYHQLLGFDAKPQNSILAPVHMSPYSALIPSSVENIILSHGFHSVQFYPSSYPSP
ncbi:hypothetical protein EYC80_000291 [Monilinia laxa]|uniref:Uncharacterized protein n=1 Tax=Monilinia laxa TaxID=61186 RepID=A0A5N6KA96_MONLA|nr:hypothetical protein EYC80_000291 [Monilinia laxa]